VLLEMRDLDVLVLGVRVLHGLLYVGMSHVVLSARVLDVLVLDVVGAPPVAACAVPATARATARIAALTSEFIRFPPSVLLRLTRDEQKLSGGTELENEEEMLNSLTARGCDPVAAYRRHFVAPMRAHPPF
jgi:hypothetical protein